MTEPNNDAAMAPMPLDDELEARVAAAVENFMQGYGCAQSVVAAFAEDYGFTREQALRLSAGFGGGVGRMRMMCGAVSGLVTLAGMDCGQTEGADRAGKAACYGVVQRLVRAFRERNGSVVCAELLGLKGGQPVTHIPDERTADYYRRRPCAAKVASAARIFAEYLQQRKNDDIR